MERVSGRQEKMEDNCSTGQSPQWAVVPRIIIIIIIINHH